MIVELVGEYEGRELASASEVFSEELGERFGRVCSHDELSDFCLRLYSAVARDIAMFAQDHDFDDDRRYRTVRVLLAEFDRKMHNRNEHGEPLDGKFDPTEVLDDLVKAGWHPKSATPSGWTMLHDLAGDATMDCFAAASAITWLLEHGANVMRQTNVGCRLSTLPL